jgi:uncharacterized protein
MTVTITLARYLAPVDSTRPPVQCFLNTTAAIRWKAKPQNQEENPMRHLIALLLTLSVINLHAEPQISGTPSEINKYLQPEPAIVTLTGEGQIYVQADQAIIRILVTTENKTLSEAIQRNETLRNNLTKTLVSKGVPTDRIVSSKFSSTPEQSNWSDKIKNYKVEHQVKVTIENGQQFSAIAALVDQSQEMRLQSVQPEVSDKDEQSAKALAEAFKQVEKRKAVYEQYLGQKLSPKTANETFVQSRPESTQVMARVIGNSGSYPKAATPIPGIAAAEFNPTGFFGEISYRVVVSVDYYVGSKPKFTFQ